MAISVFPVPSSSGGVSAFTISATSAATLYSSAFTVAKGVYTITTSPTSAVAVVDFWSGNTFLGQTRTTSGTVTYNLGTAADLIYVTVDTGNTNVTLTLVANSAIVSGISGTLDTLTSTQTYTQTGKAYAVIVGGGGGGMGNMFGNNGGGGGGGGGGLLATPITLTGSTAVTIGAAGIAGTGGNPNPNVNANAGGATTFGNFTANGGGGGVREGGGGGGTPSGYSWYNANANGSKDIGGANINPATFIINGNNGGGGGYGGAGRGTNIGTGGGGNSSPGTGYGAGGGGFGNNNNAAGTGGNGTAGVVYVLRGLA
jgi:hypothetical protein